MTARPIRATMRRGTLAAVLAVAALAGAVAAPASAAPSEAAQRYAVGSAGMTAALDIARRHWGTEACGGEVTIGWVRDDRSINARAMWANPRSAYDDPELNIRCRIVFNHALDFSWEKFCSVLVHEYGHLLGYQHHDDEHDVMAAVYRSPLAACAKTADPAGSRSRGRSAASRNGKR